MMFEVSIGIILAIIVLALFPSLLFAALHFIGFLVLALIGGVVVFYLATTIGVPVQNAFWVSVIAGLISGVAAMLRLTRLIAQGPEVALR